MYISLAPPRAVVVEAVGRALVVQWLDEGDRIAREGITHYDLYRSTGEAGSWLHVVSAYPCGPADSSKEGQLAWCAWTDRDTTSGTTYRYGVRVVGYYYGNLSALLITTPITAP